MTFYQGNQDHARSWQARMSETKQLRHIWYVFEDEKKEPKVKNIRKNLEMEVRQEGVRYSKDFTRGNVCH